MSYDDSPADGLTNAARVTVPLVINNAADLACTPSHAQRLYQALGGMAIKAMSILKGPTIIILSGAIYWTARSGKFLTG